MTPMQTRLTRRLRGLAALASLAVIAAAAPAAAPAATATTSGSLDQAKLWATINVCDTPSRPGTIGLRASMPGSGVSADEMFMRFQVQYFSAKDGIWRSLAY